MLEGTVGCGAERAVAPGPCPARPEGSEAARRETLARLSAMILGSVGRRRPLNPDAGEEDVAVAGAWLDALDRHDYAVSWMAAAPALRDAICEDDWYTALRAVRTPFGRCLERRLRSRARLDPPTGAPAGPWIVLRFETRFEWRLGMIETVAAHRSGDGRWRVAAYFVG